MTDAREQALYVKKRVFPVALSIFFIAWPSHFALAQAPDNSILAVRLSNPIALPLDQVLSISHSSIVATITEGGTAFAVGFVGDLVFKTRLHEGVSQAFGISQGVLAFARGEQLRVINLYTGDERILLPDARTVFAEWHPLHSKLAIVVRAARAYGLLLYSFTDGNTTTIRGHGVHSLAVRWTHDDGRLVFVQVKLCT